MTCQLTGAKSVDPVPQCGELQKAPGGVLGWLFYRIYEIYVRVESYIIVIYVLF